MLPQGIQLLHSQTGVEGVMPMQTFPYKLF